MHVVWDWNGTLLDDMSVVLASVNAGLRPYRPATVTIDDYRTHYTRPVKRFYDSLLSREISDDEWVDIDDRFHAAYRTRVREAPLAPGARDVLKRSTRHGMSQSLLSMYPHRDLIPLVVSAGIDNHFDRIDGLVGTPGGRKAEYLESHLGKQGADPGATLVVGDTPDDAHAAAAVGAECVLVDSGGHHRPALEATGVRVAAGLVEAIAPYLGD